MFSENIIEKGKKVNLVNTSTADGLAKNTIGVFEITDIRNDNLIDMKLMDNKEIELKTKLCYEMTIYNEGNVYICNVYVQEPFISDIDTKATVRIVSPFSSARRRSHQRHMCYLPFEYAIYNDLWQKKDEDDIELNDAVYQYSKSYINDISGGGFRFISDEYINISDVFKVKISLPEPYNCILTDIYADVVSCQKTMNADGKYDIRLKYLKMPEDTRESIIRYVFELEKKDFSDI